MKPPKVITKLIEKFSDRNEREFLLGDMYEEYQQRRDSVGKFRADVAYLFDFFSLVSNRLLKDRSHSTKSNFVTMMFNAFRLTFRRNLRQPLHNSINIIGLAIGLAVSFTIGLYVSKELSYDKFHSKADRIYLAPMTWKFGTSRVATSGSTSGVGPILKDLFAEVDVVVRTKQQPMIFIVGGEALEDRDLLVADSGFFNVFDFELITGDAKTALIQPNSLVLTEVSAKRYFGDNWNRESIVGKTIIGQNSKVYNITGVAKNPPQESMIQFGTLMSMTSLPKRETEISFDSSNMMTYLLLHPNASAVDMVASIPGRVAKKYGAEYNEAIELDLVPLTDVYLRNQKYQSTGNTSDMRYIYVFSAIAALVLIIAIINYMNLSTARSMERAREVGVRKVVGAFRGELFWQFISESVMISFVAVVLAVGLCYLALPVFSQLSGKVLTIDLASHPQWIVAVVTIWLLVSFLGGAYPAGVLSSFRPVSVLKGKIGSLGSGAILRKSLVVFQFAVSIVLIICTITINNQLSFMVNSKIGIDKEQLITVSLDSVGRRNLSIIQDRFENIGGVESSVTANTVPVDIASQTVVFGQVGEKGETILNNIGVGPGFSRTAGLELIAGKDFSPEIQKDSTWEFMVNESAVNLFGWTNENAIGRELRMWMVKGSVTGVVKDFHYAPLHKAVAPLIIHSGFPNQGGYMNKLIVRIHGDNLDGIIAALGEQWTSVVPSSPFSYSFADEQYHSLYKSESRLSRIMNIFSFLAIIIAGLGLFGLASYTIMLRTKELGIRKILGASLSTLLLTVSGNFVTLVILAFVIATPISWFVMSTWLENFAYTTDFNWMVVLLSGLAAIGVAVATVLYHAVGAVRLNPVQTLRSE